MGTGDPVPQEPGLGVSPAPPESPGCFGVATGSVSLWPPQSHPLLTCSYPNSRVFPSTPTQTWPSSPTLGGPLTRTPAQGSVPRAGTRHYLRGTRYLYKKKKIKPKLKSKQELFWLPRDSGAEREGKKREAHSETLLCISSACSEQGDAAIKPKHSGAEWG